MSEYRELQNHLSFENLPVYALASGGRDSTAMVLLAKEQGVSLTLVYGDTGIDRGDSLRVVQKLSALTGYSLQVVRYEGEKKPLDVVKESFACIPEAIAAMRRVNQFRRNIFDCCRILKHEPMEKFCDQSGVFLLGLKIGDGAIHRRYRMRQLQDWNTRFRRHMKNGRLFYYPLRDYQNDDIQEVLRRYDLQAIHSSGCRICPIFCLFPSWAKKDPATWLASRSLARKMKIEFPECEQQTLTQWCVGQ